MLKYSITNVGDVNRMRKSQKIRVKSQQNFSFFEGFSNGDSLTRDQAIHRIRQFLSFSIISPEAQRLIGLFSIHPEELAEAGLCYETLKVLERHASFL
jgi:hypothetical protein